MRVRDFVGVQGQSRREAPGGRRMCGRGCAALGGRSRSSSCWWIGIIAVLSGILMPALARVREQSRWTARLANLRSLGHGLFVYANMFRDRLPNGNPRGVWVNYVGSNRVSWPKPATEFYPLQ
jgi:hypothetical protein